MPTLFKSKLIVLPRYEHASRGLKIFVCKNTQKEKPFELFLQEKGLYNEKPLIVGRFKDLDTAQTALCGLIEIKTKLNAEVIRSLVSEKKSITHDDVLFVFTGVSNNHGGK